MKTQTLSTRLTPDEAERIDAMAQRAGVERATLIKQLLRRGIADLALEQACEAYRSGEVSLSRAAEMAGLGLRDLLLRLPSLSLEMNYGLDDLGDDLEGLR